MNILCEDAPRYYMHILMHLADRPPVPEDVVDFNVLGPLTAHGLSEGLGLPISNTYVALRWMMAGGMITPLPQLLRKTQQPARAYRITEYGRKYAEAMRVFKQTVEAL